MVEEGREVGEARVVALVSSHFPSTSLFPISVFRKHDIPLPGSKPPPWLRSRKPWVEAGGEDRFRRLLFIVRGGRFSFVSASQAIEATAGFAFFLSFYLSG